MIRWKAVAPTLTLLLAGSLLTVFLLDPFVKWAIVKAGESVFGARVGVRSAAVSLRRSSLRIRGMTVADKSEPMSNLFEFDEAAFDFRSLPLLEKKVIIDEASLTGLKFGTPRRTSGALPRVEKRPGAVGKAVDRLWNQVETVSLEKFEGVQKYADPKTAIHPDRLATHQAANQAKETLQKAPDDIQKEINQLNAPQRAEDFKKRVQSLSRSGGDPSAILQKVKEVQALQSDLQAFKKEAAGVQQAVTDRIQSAQSLLEEVKKAREEDWKNLRAALSLPTLDKASLARALFGPAVVRWTERILGWVHTAREYMPPKPRKPAPPPRGRGRTIEFPRQNALPRFLLVKASLSGEVGAEQPFGFSGRIEGITTNPKLYGKPAFAKVEGSRGDRSFRAEALLNHARETPYDSFSVAYDGFPLKNLSFGQADSFGFGLRQGVGRARGVVIVQGDELRGSADLEGSGLALEPRIDFKSDAAIARRAAGHVAASLAAVKSLNAGVGLSGTLASPDFSVHSNIGAVAAEALKKAMGAEIAEQEKALRAELDRLTRGKIQELQGMIEELRQKYLPQLAGQNKLIDDLINQAKNKASGFSSPGKGANPLAPLKGLFSR